MFVVISLYILAIGTGAANGDAVAREDVVLQLPAALRSFEHNDEGNLTHDGIWTYRWDARGRLALMKRSPDWLAAGNVDEALNFEYDLEGRRIYKHYRQAQEAGVTLEDLPGADTATLAVDRAHKFVYDGMSLLAERIEEASGAPNHRFYTWGPDISSVQGGSGGAGGLLAISDEKSGRTYLPIHDGRGHIMALVDGQTKETVAQFEYGPFGEPLLAKGEAKDLMLCPFGYASQYTDAESGLVYLGRRYYDPLTGRFLSREPLGDLVSLNPYAYCTNAPTEHVDVYGMRPEGATRLFNPVDPNTEARIGEYGHPEVTVTYSKMGFFKSYRETTFDRATPDEIEQMFSYKDGQWVQADMYARKAVYREYQHRAYARQMQMHERYEAIAMYYMMLPLGGLPGVAYATIEMSHQPNCRIYAKGIKFLCLNELLD